MTAPYALLIGIIVGAAIVLIARRNPYQAKILEQVQHLAGVFAHPAHRGRAAEFALENLLEITGLGKYRDFDLQVTLPEGGRPDVVLKFPGRGTLAIDSKFPLDHYQRALATTNETQEHNAALRNHAKALAGHVADLAKRGYPSSLPDSLGFVVLYVPSEDLLTAAYLTQPGLFHDAVKRHVLLAGPATALAIFWSITYGLQQQALSQNARQIGKSAAELHRRLGKLAEPLQKLGRTMTTAVGDYDSILATLEGRVFPEVRRLEKLGALTPGTELPEIPPLDARLRPVAIEDYSGADTDSQDERHAGGPADEDLTDDELNAEWVSPDEEAALNATYLQDEDSGNGYPDGNLTTGSGLPLPRSDE
jgi:DNA recombination protein RmuC